MKHHVHFHPGDDEDDEIDPTELSKLTIEKVSAVPQMAHGHPWAVIKSVADPQPRGVAMPDTSLEAQINRKCVKALEKSLRSAPEKKARKAAKQRVKYNREAFKKSAGLDDPELDAMLTLFGVLNSDASPDTPSRHPTNGQYVTPTEKSELKAALNVLSDTQADSVSKRVARLVAKAICGEGGSNNGGDIASPTTTGSLSDTPGGLRPTLGTLEKALAEATTPQARADAGQQLTYERLRTFAEGKSQRGRVRKAASLTVGELRKMAQDPRLSASSRMDAGQKATKMALEYEVLVKSAIFDGDARDAITAAAALPHRSASSLASDDGSPGSTAAGAGSPGNPAAATAKPSEAGHYGSSESGTRGSVTTGPTVGPGNAAGGLPGITASVDGGESTYSNPTEAQLLKAISETRDPLTLDRLGRELTYERLRASHV